MNIKRMLARKVSNWESRNERHGKPRTTIGHLTRLQHCRNAGMIKGRNRLLLSAKASVRDWRGQRVTQYLHCHKASNWMLLATKKHLSESTCTKTVKQDVPTSTPIALRHGVTQLNAHTAHRCIDPTGT
jgi:hypothetical protein